MPIQAQDSTALQNTLAKNAIISQPLVHVVEPTINNGAKTVPTTTTTPGLRNDLLLIKAYGAKEIWSDLLLEGEQLMKEQQQSSHQSQSSSSSSSNKKKPLIVIEVGANTAQQSIQAAQHGFEAHCVEPSPVAYEKMIKEVEKEPDDVKAKVFVYNKAAGDTKEGYLDFVASGGTGDHVGQFDMWNMVKGMEMEKDLPQEKQNKVVKVQAIQMDQILNNEIGPDYKTAPHADIDTVFFMKVDTQGFEPRVFEGLKDAIQKHRIHYIMTEFWPKGIDLLSESEIPCTNTLSYLFMLADAGYTLYATPIMSHPKAPRDSYKYMKNWESNKRPLHDIGKDCWWIYNIEEENPSNDYFMGYWTNIVAVAPNAPLPNEAVTFFGKAMKKVTAVE